MRRKKNAAIPPERLIRGVSPKKYFVLRRLVTAGKTTWSKLERRGFCGKAERGSEFRRETLRELMERS